MKKVIGKAFKVILWIVAGVILLAVALVLLIQVPAVQDFGRKKIVSYLQEKFQTEVAIGHIRLGLPNTLLIENIYIEDRQEDTLLAAGKLFADVSLFRLLKDEVRINEISVEKFYANIHRREDSTFNFDFITEAFETEETPPELRDTSASPLVISLDEITLEGIRLDYRDETLMSEAAVALGYFHTRMNESDIETMRFGARETETRALYLSYNDQTAGLETLLRLGRLDLSNLHVDLLQQQAALGRVLLDSTRADIAFHNPGTGAAPAPDSTAETVAEAAMDAEAAADGTAGADSGWAATVEQLQVSNTGFRFNDHTAMVQPGGMDYMHLDVTGLNLDMRDFAYSPLEISGSLQAASFQEKSGFVLHTLQTDFLYTATGAALENLLLETGESRLRERIRIGYPSLEEISENPGALSIDAVLRNCRLSYADMLLLAPFLSEYEPFASTRGGFIDIDGVASGTLDDLRIENLEASTLDKTRLMASAHLKGLPDMEKAWFDIQLRELRSGRQDISRLAGPGMIPASVRVPADIALEATFKGSINAFSGEALLRSSYGNISAEGNMAPGSGEGRERYSARVNMVDFDLGRLLKQEDTLGRVSLAASVEGSGTTLETADAGLEGLLQKAVYRGYEYKDLGLKGSIRNRQVQAVAGISDPNLDFKLDAFADLSGKYPALRMDLRLDTLNLQALHLYEKEMELRLRLTADLPTADPDYLNGTLAVQDLFIRLDSGAYLLDTLQFRASASDTLKTMDFSTEFMHANLAGNFTPTKVGSAVMRHVNRYFRIAAEDSLALAGAEKGPAGKDPAAGALKAFTGAPGDAPAGDSGLSPDSIQQLTLTARIFNPPILNELLPELSRLDTICVDAHFDEQAHIFQLSAIVPAVRYGSNEVDSVLLAINTADTSIDYHLGIQQFYNPAVQLVNTSLDGELAGNRAGIHLVTRDTEMEERYRIGGTLTAGDQAYMFRFNPGELLLDYEEWNIREDHLFYYSDSGFYAQNIQLSNAGQLLRVNSEEYSPGAPLGLSFNDFQLSTLTRLAQQDSLAIGGKLSGSALLSNFDSTLVVVSDLLVDDFSFRRDTVGDITMKVSNEEENAYSADISVKSDRNQVNLAGYYYTEPLNGNNFDLALDIINLDMKTVEAFSFGQLIDASGDLKGSFTVSGTMEEPSVLGGLAFREVAFTPTYINSPLFLEDETIALTEEGIGFSQFTLLDSMRNSAVLNGMIYTTDFSNFRFGLNFKTSNFRAINTRPGDNELYYGQLYLDSDISIKGTMDNPDVDAYVRVNEKTDLTMLLPSGEPGMQEREGVVEFVDMDAPPDTLQADTLKAEAGIVGLSLTADLEVDEEAQFTVIIDPVNGDNLKVKGKAALSTSIDPNGVINLTGRYEISEGSYELSFNLIRRRFEITEGSYITWVGNPYSADVDITAVYVAETAPMELVQDQLSSMSQSERNTFKQTLPFQVELHLEGELMKPQISFNIDLPEKEREAHGGMVYARLQQLQLQESELNKQVFALLVLNRFVAENPLESAGGASVSSMARESVSKLLSEQLNRLAGDLIAGVDLNFDLESSEDYSTGEKVDRTDLNVGLSKSLLNDRIRVNVGSSFGLEGQEARGRASTIAGDVSVDYQLSRDGRYLLRAYRQNEYEGVIEGQIIETGLSFIISLDYDEFKELFRK